MGPGPCKPNQSRRPQPAARAVACPHHFAADPTSLAHRIVVMDKGRIVEAGPLEALIKQPKGL